MNASTAQYWNGSFFLFVPNVCNARCAFCYVRPKYVSTAKLAAETLKRAAVFFPRLYALGFRECRITGGDPTVFVNLPDLIRLASDAGLAYTILTNGFEGRVLAECIEYRLPQKVTVSFHSFASYADYFGVDRNWPDAVKVIEMMLRRGVDVCITCVVFRKNAAEIPAMIDFFHTRGVMDFKLVLPNLPESGGDADTFRSLLERLSVDYSSSWNGARIRVTDQSQRTCLLSTRGYVSFAMPSFAVYDCCVNVGEKPALELDADFSNLEMILIRLEHNRAPAEGLPCIAYHNSCPIALKEVQ